MKALSLWEDPELFAFLTVCHELPDDERDQWQKITGTPYNVADAAARLYTQGGPRWAIVSEDDGILVVCGATFVRRGVWDVWYFARSVAWQKYGEEVTNITQGLIQMMFHDFGAHRLEVVCLPDRERARRWYEKHLRLQCEGVMTAFCADGSDAVRYTATRV